MIDVASWEFGFTGEAQQFPTDGWGVTPWGMGKNPGITSDAPRPWGPGVVYRPYLSYIL